MQACPGRRYDLTMKRMLTVMLAVLLAMSLLLTGCAKGEEAPATSDEPKTSETGDDAQTEQTEAEDDYAYISDKGTLTIGITIYDPMNYYDEDGKLVGFDTEFAEAVCEILGVEPEFQEINWDTKEIELEAKNIDCIWNGFTVTEERRENMDFSDSYIKNMQVMVIRAADADVYTDTASLADKTVVAEISSAGETAIADDENLSQATYVSVPKQTDALLEVKSGTADAAVLDYTLAMSMVGEGTDYSDLMLVPDVELAVEEYAIGFRLGSNMVEKVNEAIGQLVEDGTLDEIAAKYDLTDSLISNQ